MRVPSRPRPFLRNLLRASCALLLTCLGSNAAAETLTLREAVELARKQAPVLASARAKAQAADARASVARAPYFPTMTGSLAGSATTSRDTQAQAPPRTGVFEFVNHFVSLTGRVGVQWTIWDFGKTSNAVDAADAIHKTAALSADNTEASLVGDVATAYLNVVFLEQLRELAVATTTQREKFVLLAKALVKSQIQPAVEELRAISRLEAARRDLASREQDAQDGRTILATLLGLDPTSKVAVAVPHLQDVRGEASDVSHAMQQAETSHKSLAVAKASLEQQRAEASASASKYLPTLALNLDGSYRFSQYDRTDPLINARSASAMVILSGPIFDISVPNQVAASRADARQAEADLEQARRQVRSDAARGAQAVRTTASLMEHAKKAADASAIVLAVIQARYAQGLSSPLELFDAETTDIDARAQKIRAELSFALAEVQYLVATGQAKRIDEGETAR